MNLRQRWDENAPGWIAWAGQDYFFDELNLPSFLALLPTSPGLCLDLGCGEGRVGRTLRTRGFDVVGIDGSPALAAAAAAGGSAGRVTDGFPAATGDAARLPMRSDAFDLVVAFMVLQDVDDLEAAVGEVARVLRPGGTLCAAIVHPFFSAGWLQLGDRVTTYGGRSYFEAWDYDEVVRNNGLAVTLHSVHRPLQDHVKAVADAGMVIEALGEPHPSAEFVSAHPDAAPLADVPLYLHYRARSVSRGKPTDG